MKKTATSFSVLFFSLFFVLFFAASVKAESEKAEVVSWPAPTIIAEKETTFTSEKKPLLVGLTKSGSAVKIYIDDQPVGQTAILNHDSGTANFAFRPSANLDLGLHKFAVAAVDGPGNESALSRPAYFKIELPFPAPTLFKPVINSNTTSSRPYIVGLAKNDSRIKVYIDKKLAGEFLVKNHTSGTANFAFKPAILARGSHTVYAIALDGRDKASQPSRTVNFTVKQAAIAVSASEKNNSAVKTAAGAATDKNLKAAAENSGGENQAKTAAGGLIDESRLNQQRLKFGSLIFILFLLSVISWLVWVNHELVKERRRAEAPENKTQDKLL